MNNSCGADRVCGGDPAVPAAAYAHLIPPALVDLFAGAGGASIGIEQAFTAAGFRDRYIDLMVNHWDVAVGVHELNHPMTKHLHASVWEVDPAKVLPGRRIGHLHLSPDCADFSRAKGGVPKRKHIRALADVGIVWAEKRRPDVLTLENVPEFQDWGPLLSNGKPDPNRRGEEFRRWVGELEALGYLVEWRTLRACDYGAPTSRLRLFVIARCDGKPITWPEPTHGPEGSGLLPYRTAAENIDWGEPMCSIFATPEEAKAWAKQVNVGRPKAMRIGTPRRPLKHKTQMRLARGLEKFVLRAAEPFIVDIQNHGWNRDGALPATKPLPTITANPKGGARLAAVHLVKFRGDSAGHAAGDPCPTITAGAGAKKDAGAAHALGVVAAHITKHFGGVIGTRADKPLGTVTATDHNAITCAFLAPYCGSSKTGHHAGEPLPTITGNDRFCLVTCDGVSGWPLTPNQLQRAKQLARWAYRLLGDAEPTPRKRMRGKARLSPRREPLLTARDFIWCRDAKGKAFPLLLTKVHGTPRIIYDLSMRMFVPRELAACQGFPADYVIDRTTAGQPVRRADQVKLIGNSVPPALMRALISANVIGVCDWATPLARSTPPRKPIAAMAMA